MDPIGQTVPSFLHALEAGESIAVTTDGAWCHKGIIRRVVDLFRSIFCGYDEAYENAKNLTVFLSSPVKVTSDQLHGISQPATWNPDDLARVVEAVKATIQQKVTQEERQLHDCTVERDSLQTSLPSASPTTQIVELNRTIFNPEGWTYRFAAANLDRAFLMHRYLGVDQRKIDFTVINPEDGAWMQQELIRWQKQQFPYVEYLVEEKNDDLFQAVSRSHSIDDFIGELADNIPLLDTCCTTHLNELPLGQKKTIDEFLALPSTRRHLRKIFSQWKRHEAILAKIHHCCCYTDFITAARGNRALLDMCFQTVFKSMPDEFTNAIDIFLQAPQIQEQLRRTYLDKRIREVANQGLKFVQYSGSGQEKPIKGVELLIDGEYQSITDEKATVRVAKDVNTTVGEIFKEFEAQNFRFIEMEYLQDKGVAPFDGRLLNPDFDKEEWWKDLPIIKRMTREQIEDAYDADFQEGHAFFALRASRTTPDLNAGGNHGWADLLIPLPDGTFNCLSLGKFSDWFPVNRLEEFYFVFHTHKGNATVLDTNSFMSSRDRISIPLPPLSEEQFTAIMKDLRNEFRLSRENKLVFQAQGDNCASWVRHLIQRNWNGLDIEPYQTPFHDLLLPTLFMPLVWIRSNWFRHIFSSLFGAMSYHNMKDGTGVRLLDNHDFLRGVLQSPARLWIERERVLARVNDYMRGEAAAAVFRQPAPVAAEAVAI